MNRNDLFKSLNEIDDNILERSERVKKISTNNLWIKITAAAAVMCIIFIGSIIILTQDKEPDVIIPAPQSNSYPYNDNEVLDYIEKPINDKETELGIIKFNAITDIEAYRKYNTFYGFNNKPYYSTRKSGIDILTSIPVEHEDDFINVSVFEKDGSFANCPGYNDFLKLKEYSPFCADLILHLFEKDLTDFYNIFYNKKNGTCGILFNPDSNCIATAVIGENISLLDSRYDSIIPIFKSTLGTNDSSFLGGQEFSIHYFYQNRLFHESKTEEAYQYYVYFEHDELEVLLQFSSNWSLIDQNVSALHNPPHTLHYVKTQEGCLDMFIDYINALASILPEINQ